MCGIICYKGPNDGNKIIIKGLKQLEYRGYDSWGIASKYKDRLEIIKKIGKIGEYNDFSEIKSANIAMGHTRWATHGTVTEKNAHPHISSNKKIAVVHNGIIENYEELKNELIEKGYEFNSKTDTEVIPHLIEEYAKNNEFEEAVTLVLKKLEGTYAIIVINNDSDKIIAARKASPLVLGIGEKEFFIASDVPAFLEYTKKVIFLEDNEMVVINDEYKIKNIETGKEFKKNQVEIDWDAEQAQKGEFEHFMLKEIFEQPVAIENTITSRIKDNKVFFEDFKLTDDYLKSINRIMIVACGTSWHAGLVGKLILESLGKIPVEVDYASEFRYRNPILDDKTLVIAISQSGETADTLAAMKEAKSKGATVLSICNVIGSSIPREADETIYTRAGIEIGVASTKAFTTQLSVLYLLGVYLAQLRGTWPEEHLIERLDYLKRIPEQIESMLKKDKEIMDCAKDYYRKTNAIYLGRGTNFPIALEGALKLKEVSYLHAEGYPAAEMKHGPIALVDNQMPVVVICVKDESYVKIKGNMEEIKSRGGIIISIATEGDEEIKKISDHVLYVPETSGLLYPFLTVVPLQLLAYHIAKLRECDIDKPKNLAKSVTVE
ncbi:glutamine--fructose-6-phosphate transaminase (isomerizing) [Candidatus Woesearchaeota archaeon B3_Woes]|nr:MAG: glutamine--fructose-6-phosphate transaminase (isomerizing) [Candidatus Woesearchaeota archaeon B3_Woes]